MGQQTKEILEGLKKAMEAELTGYEFYKNAAKSTNDPMGRETFSRMAEEEMGHFKYLQHQYGAVLKKGGYDFSKKRAKKRHNHAESPIFSQEIREGIKDAHFEMSALAIGMKLELDAMKFYRNCAKKASDREVKNFYEELAAWESDHYHAFENELHMLREDYFHANHFVPM